MYCSVLNLNLNSNCHCYIFYPERNVQNWTVTICKKRDVSSNNTMCVLPSYVEDISLMTTPWGRNVLLSESLLQEVAFCWSVSLLLI
jgi:hypothetical protein